MQKDVSRVRLSLALGVAILAVSTASILIRLAQEDAPSITIGALRLSIATLILSPVALTRHLPEIRSLRRHDLFLAVLSGGFLALHFGTWISSLEYTKVASSVVLVSTGPLWVALLSPIFLGEKATRAVLLGLALALVGGTLIALGDTCNSDGGFRCGNVDALRQSRGLWGNLLALAGAWAVSGYLIIGRRLRITLSLVPYVALVYGVAALGLLGTALFARSLQLHLPARTYGWIILLAVVPQLIGHSTFNWALRHLTASLVALTTLGEPIGSAILAYVLLGESPGIFAFFGATMILVGIYLAARGTPTAREPSA